ncbi:transcription elongation factor spt4 [Saccharata proteae CBS 121410]|uniref:Transcription elongation factor SPT4 n=1 Tax=Saccharata proteae CBS 121410 TaxID=1314787 RepID=A0A9P4LUD4_9PEZI|nr:transcription elongation factor spt4 [Saccharata proteae CBS 121410]
MAYPAPTILAPNQTRTLRACMVCSIVLPEAKFRRDGCPNCDDYLEMKGNPEVVQDTTSQVFEGLIALTDPTQSWVARWQRLDKYLPGNYAVKVVGLLPDEFQDRLEEAGIKYIPRDGTEAQVEEN